MHSLRDTGVWGFRAAEVQRCGGGGVRGRGEGAVVQRVGVQECRGPHQARGGRGVHAWLSLVSQLVCRLAQANTYNQRDYPDEVVGTHFMIR